MLIIYLGSTLFALLKYLPVLNEPDYTCAWSRDFDRQINYLDVIFHEGFHHDHLPLNNDKGSKSTCFKPPILCFGLTIANVSISLRLNSVAE